MSPELVALSVDLVLTAVRKLRLRGNEGRCQHGTNHAEHHAEHKVEYLQQGEKRYRLFPGFNLRAYYSGVWSCGRHVGT